MRLECRKKPVPPGGSQETQEGRSPCKSDSPIGILKPESKPEKKRVFSQKGNLPPSSGQSDSLALSNMRARMNGLDIVLAPIPIADCVQNWAPQ
jgi:hypothetical protein